jgi:hypothetical protein
VATNFDIVRVLKEALLDRQILSDIIVKEKIQEWLRFFTRFYVGGGGRKGF